MELSISRSSSLEEIPYTALNERPAAEEPSDAPGGHCLLPPPVPFIAAASLPEHMPPLPPVPFLAAASVRHPQQDFRDAAIDRYVAQKLEKIGQGKSRVSVKISGFNGIASYERKVGLPERAASAISKKTAVITGKLATAMYGFWSATLFARLVCMVVGMAVPGAAPVDGIVNRTVGLAAVPAVAADSAVSSRLVNILAAKANNEVKLLDNYEDYKEYRRCTRAGIPVTPEVARHYLEALAAAAGLPALQRYLAPPGSSVFQRLRAEFAALRDGVVQTVSLTYSVVNTAGHFGHVHAISSVAESVAMPLTTVTGVIDLGHGLVEYQDHKTRQGHAETLHARGEVLRSDRDPLMRAFGCALSEYGKERAELAGKDMISGAVRTIKGGLLATLGLTGLGLGLAAIPVSWPAFSGAAAGISGFYMASVAYKQYYTYKYNKRQEKLQKADFVWMNNRGPEKLLEEFRNPGPAGARGAEDTGQAQQPTLHIRGMLNVAAALLDGMRDELRQPTNKTDGDDHRACRLILEALDLDPSQCRAILQACSDMNDPRARVAFIEGHLAKAISLDLVKVERTPPHAGRSDARAIESLLKEMPADGDPLDYLDARGFQVDQLPLVYMQLVRDSVNFRRLQVDPGQRELLQRVASLAHAHAQQHPEDRRFVAVTEDIGRRVAESHAKQELDERRFASVAGDLALRLAESPVVDEVPDAQRVMAELGLDALITVRGLPGLPNLPDLPDHAVLLPSHSPMIRA